MFFIISITTSKTTCRIVISDCRFHGLCTEYSLPDRRFEVNRMVGGTARHKETGHFAGGCHSRETAEPRRYCTVSGRTV